MPAFDESVRALRSHLVTRRKPLEMGGVFVSGRPGLVDHVYPMSGMSGLQELQASRRSDGARGSRGEEVPAS